MTILSEIRFAVIRIWKILSSLLECVRQACILLSQTVIVSPFIFDISSLIQILLLIESHAIIQ